MKTNPKQIQQGDVLLFHRVEKLPAGCVRRKDRTVALGEHTGHHHTFEDGVAVLDAPDGRTFVVNETDKPKQMLHQEHSPVIGEPQVPYEFGQVREKDWFTEMVAPVWD
jgi:hypothetical protein